MYSAVMSLTYPLDYGYIQMIYIYRLYILAIVYSKHPVLGYTLTMSVTSTKLSESYDFYRLLYTYNLNHDYNFLRFTVNQI